MGDYFSTIPSGVLALALAAAMSVACAAGWRAARRAESASAPGDKFTDASMAILGLLLAFSFGMSLDKHNQRRQMVVADANAIGDFYTCASLLKEPVRSQLRAQIKAYTEYRIATVEAVDSDEEFRARLADIPAQQAKMQDLVSAAVDADSRIAVPLVNTLNALTSNHAARLAAGYDHLPTAIIVLLFLASTVSAYLAGAGRGKLPTWFGGSVAGFILLVTLVVWITLDLNQSNRGVIRVDQSSLRRVLAGMG